MVETVGTAGGASPLPPFPEADGTKAIYVGTPGAVRKLLGIPARLTFAQAAWLARVPVSVLGAHAAKVHRALSDADMRGLIPRAERLRAEEEERCRTRSGA